LDGLESRGVRLLDRISQRAVGETLMADSVAVTVRFIDFIKSLNDPDVARWLAPLAALLVKARHTRELLQLLTYGQQTST
jgi:hypothetical protein